MKNWYHVDPKPSVQDANPLKTDCIVLSYPLVATSVPTFVFNCGPWWSSGMVLDSGPDCSNYDTGLDPRTPLYIDMVHAKFDVLGQMSFRWCGAEVWRVGHW
ncbi:hypothetical protein AVEN_159099-1 [Araneus ventricosus]|uniref:Uncharacterized protein n=1 Tax=Araneus ventricosus TaxID=182803 RepID=A0A4Y2B8Y6_ARAVE|nr:hypothetical protein AVEN_159099-1 [Araneus ventricosus]